MYGINNYYTPTIDERIWVQNETAAESYLVAPGGFVRLWDSQKPVFYEKRADQTGRPLPLEVYIYERENRQSAGTVDISNILKRLERLEAEHEHDADAAAISAISE